MNKTFWRVWCRISILIFALGFGLASCSDAPENDSQSKLAPIEPPPSLNGDVNLQKFSDKLKLSPDVFSYPGELDGIGSAEEAQLREANLRKPILYGVGAGGITMDTTFEEYLFQF